MAFATGSMSAVHLVASRMLGPSGYGALGAVLSIMAILVVPAVSCQTLFAAEVARRRDRDEHYDPTRALHRALVVGGAGTVLLLVLAPAITAYLRLPSLAPALWLALYCVPLAVDAVAGGVLYGRRRFWTVSLVTLAGALCRLGCTVLFIELGFGLTGAVAASICADGLRAVVLWLLVRRSARRGAPVLWVDPGQALAGTAAMAGLWLLLAADGMLARHIFQPADSGHYTAAVTVTLPLVVLAQAVGMLVLPRFAALGPRRAQRLLIATLVLLAGCGGAAGLALAASGRWLLPVLFGEDFAASTGLVAVRAAAATGLGILWVLVQYHLARRHTLRTLVAWPAVIVLAVSASVWHPGPGGLAGLLALCVAAAIVLGLTGANLARPVRRPEPVPASPAGLDLSVVVPFHNPGEQLRPHLLALVGALRDTGMSFEVIAVADGCTDGSPGSVTDLGPLGVRTIRLSYNMGKGAAVRVGLREGRGRYLGFIDGDGDLDPAHWLPILGLIRLYEPDAVIGSKRHPLSHVGIEVSWTRRLCSAGYRGLVGTLFPYLPVRDTQVGLKVFRREMLAELLPLSVERRYVLDLELLVAGWRHGYRRILPAPVTLRRTGRSTVNPRAVWWMLADTLRLAVRTLRGDYDPVPVPRSGNRAPVPSMSELV